MPAIVIVQGLIDVAKSLFSLKDSFAKASQEQRDRMAEYFKAISECLAATYDSLSSDVVPHGRCGEIKGYAELLPSVVRGLIDDRRAQELSDLLKRSHEVEGLMEVVRRSPNKDAEIATIAEASGIFMALSNSVKAGLKPAASAA